MSPGQLEGLRDPAYVRVRLHGRFDERHTLLLDNRLRNGQAGVEVLQPFYDQASGLWLLVNRGWVAWSDRRRRRRWKPRPRPPARCLDLPAATRRSAPGRRAGRRLAAPGDPLDIPALWQAFGRAGLPWEIRLEPGDASFDTDWPLVSMPPERHTGYAVQWFALATALLALYLYLGVRRAREKTMSLAIPMPERPRRARGRLQLLAIIGLVVGPMLLASAMYKWNFCAAGRSYSGALIGNGQTADLGGDAARASSGNCW